MLFSFCYLYFIQGEILAQAQFVFSHGVTEYSIFAGALITSVVLQTVQWVTGIASRLPLKAHALSYLPSALLMGMMCSVNEDTMNHFSFGTWIWWAPIFLVLYVVGVIIVKKLVKNPSLADNLPPLLYPNFIILLFFILLIGSVSKTSDVYHYELKTERLILQKQYAEASKVGIKSLRTNLRLTRLRMYALSKQDSLADCLFYYPQHYGSDGLLSVADTLSTMRLQSSDICLHLGAFCGKTIKTTERYMQLMMQDTIYNKNIIDYHLCSLLLDKNMKDFTKELPKYYNLSDTLDAPYDSLPRSYREALLMMSDREHALTGAIVIGGDSLATLSDTLMVSRYKQYCELKHEIKNVRERVNKTHREFGKTFWWYYDFSDKGEGELKSNRKINKPIASL